MDNNCPPQYLEAQGRLYKHDSNYVSEYLFIVEVLRLDKHGLCCPPDIWVSRDYSIGMSLSILLSVWIDFVKMNSTLHPIRTSSFHLLHPSITLPLHPYIVIFEFYVKVTSYLSIVS